MNDEEQEWQSLRARAREWSEGVLGRREGSTFRFEGPRPYGLVEGSVRHLRRGGSDLFECTIGSRTWVSASPVGVVEALDDLDAAGWMSLGDDGYGLEAYLEQVAGRLVRRGQEPLVAVPLP